MMEGVYMSNGGPQTGGVPPGGIKQNYRKAIAPITTRAKIKTAIAHGIAVGVTKAAAKANAKKKKLDRQIGGTGLTPPISRRSRKKKAY
jgi:hypothetical protein